MTWHTYGALGLLAAVAIACILTRRRASALDAAAWQAFWMRLLSPQTARFVLALMALNFAAFGALLLLRGAIQPDAREAVVFALGQLFALATIAFNYYFGSTARNDERPIAAHVVNPPSEPVPVEDERQ